MERKYRLFKEIGEADEKYIEEMRSESVAEKIRKKNLIKYGSAAKRRRAVISSLAAAAVLAVVCTAVIPQMKETENAVSTADVDLEWQAENEMQTVEAKANDEPMDEAAAETEEDAATADKAEDAVLGAGEESESYSSEDAEEGGGGVNIIDITLSNAESLENSSGENSPPYNTLEIEGVTYVYSCEITEESAGEYIGSAFFDEEKLILHVRHADGYDEGEAVAVQICDESDSYKELGWFLYVKAE